MILVTSKHDWIYASTFVWALLIAHYLLGERIQWLNLVGVVFLIVGMFLIGLRTAA